MSDEFNLFTKAHRFSEVVENPKMIAVFLSIATCPVRNYEQIIEDTGFELADVAPIVKRLQEGGFIEPNPNPLSNKFRLALNGQLFAEQLKAINPEIRELLGKESAIKLIIITKTRPSLIGSPDPRPEGRGFTGSH